MIFTLYDDFYTSSSSGKEGYRKPHSACSHQKMQVQSVCFFAVIPGPSTSFLFLLPVILASALFNYLFKRDTEVSISAYHESVFILLFTHPLLLSYLLLNSRTPILFLFFYPSDQGFTDMSLGFGKHLLIR